MSKLSNLIKLAKKGDTQRILQLLNQGNVSVNEIDGKSGRGLLHIAIQNDDNQLFEALVNRPGTDLEITTTEGQTPLQLAVRLNNPCIVGKLLDLNANFRRKNNQGQTVLHSALRNQTHKDILKRLTNNRFDINQPIDKVGSFLNLAIEAGHQDNFYFLIKDVSLEYTKRYDQEGNTCLILAVKHNRGSFVVAILEKLIQDPLLTAIDRQFFINHQNNQGNTALHQAVIKDLQTITQKLEAMGQQLGIDLSIRNRKGQTFEQIKALQEKQRLHQIEMGKKRQEEKVIRKKQKNEDKLRQREQEERRKIEELRKQKQQEKRQMIQAKVEAQTQKKKTVWIMGIILAIVLAGMYLTLTNAIQKKKPVTL